MTRLLLDGGADVVFDDGASSGSTDGDELVAQMWLESRADGQVKQIQAKPTRNAKGRLGGKASDEQRVDNCKVPPALRGSKPRPDECDDGVSTRSHK